jgi:hypothetical protein
VEAGLNVFPTFSNRAVRKSPTEESGRNRRIFDKYPIDPIELYWRGKEKFSFSNRELS